MININLVVDDNQGINILFDVIDYKEDSPIDTVVNIKRIEEI